MTTYQILNVDVQLDAVSIGDLWESITVSLGTEQDNGAATVVCTELPSGAAVSVPLYIYADIASGTPPSLFNGEIAGIEWDNSSRATLLGQDAFARLRYPWGYDTDRTYTDDDDASVIQNLVEAMGVDPSLTSIESSSWNIGVVVDLILRKGDVPLDLIRKIDEAAQYATYTRSNGAIYRTPIALGTPAITFARGDNIITSRRRQSRSGAFNRAIVRGLSIAGIPTEGEYSTAANTGVIPDPPAYITKQIYNEIIEDDTKALAVATALVARYNLLQEQVEITTWGMPDLQPGTTMIVDDSTLGTDDTYAYYISNVTHRISRSGFLTDVTGYTLP
jgi:hypothetical protein